MPDNGPWITKTIIELEERIAELECALNDQLNDCINFNGAKLTDSIMDASFNALARDADKDGGSSPYIGTFKVSRGAYSQPGSG